MTPKGHRVISGHCALRYDHKGHGDHLLSAWPSLCPEKVTRSLEFAMTYFMILNITVTIVFSLT